jgi:peptidoglycan/LPS O-acetylase OafA/YrhL
MGAVDQDRRRRIWPWVLLAVLLLLAGAILLIVLGPEVGSSAKGVAYRDRDRWLILATGEAGWLGLILSTRAGRGAGLLARLGRWLGGLVLAAGIGVAAVGGWLVSSYLRAEVHGTASSGGHVDWDD